MKHNRAYLQKVIRIVSLGVLSTALIFAGTGCSKQEKPIEIAKTSLYDFSDVISQKDMMETIKKLASKDNARVSGFEGERESADFILERFKTLGLETKEQSFPVDAYRVNAIKLDLNDTELASIEDIRVMGFSTASPKAGVQAELLSIGQGFESEYEGKDAKGKILLLRRGGIPYVEKITRAEAYGAVGAIFYDPNSTHLSGTLGSLSKIPGVSIPTETALKIEEKLASGIHIKANLLVDSETKASTSQNVIGVYKSKNNPEGKQLIVGAHYDGVDTPAANDNGSGTAVMLEMARIMTSEKVELPYDIKFIAFGSEETGLLGSSAYVYDMQEEEIKKTVAVVNVDMVGVGDTINLCTAIGQSDLPLIQQARQFCKRLSYTNIVDEVENSDHVPFAYAGVSTLTLYTSEDTNYHTDQDTPDKIQPDMLAKTCNLGLTICTELQVQ